MLRILPVGGVLLAIMRAAIRRRGTDPIARAAGYAGPRRRHAQGSPPPATIPIDIGETSSTELSGAALEEQLPVIKTPRRAQKSGSRLHRAPAASRRWPNRNRLPSSIISKRCSANRNSSSRRRSVPTSSTTSDGGPRRGPPAGYWSSSRAPKRSDAGETLGLSACAACRFLVRPPADANALNAVCSVGAPRPLALAA